MIEITEFNTLIPKYKAIWLDSYGVVKNHRGLIPGTDNIIRKIRADRGIFRLLTNDASRSAAVQSSRFLENGLQIHEHEIVTSGMMAQEFLSNKIQLGKVAYLGTKLSAAYISNAGLEPIPMAAVDTENMDDIAALVFLDDEGFDWNTDLNKVVNLVRRKKIPVVVANSDKLYPVAKNNVAIATGGLAKLMETILGRKFIHFGKPDTQMFNYAYENLIRNHPHIKKHEILMVGDTLKTDILGGNKFGVHTCLVLSGNTRLSHAEVDIKATGVIPDFICRSIVD